MGSVLPVDEHSSLVVNGSEVQQYSVALSPGIRHIESSPVPAVESEISHYTCNKVRFVSDRN